MLGLATETGVVLLNLSQDKSGLFDNNNRRRMSCSPVSKWNGWVVPSALHGRRNGIHNVDRGIMVAVVEEIKALLLSPARFRFPASRH